MVYKIDTKRVINDQGDIWGLVGGTHFRHSMLCLPPLMILGSSFSCELAFKWTNALTSLDGILIMVIYFENVIGKELIQDSTL